MKKRKWRIIFDYDDTLIRHNTGKEIKYMAEYLELECGEEFKKQLASFYSNMGLCIPKGKITLSKYENYLLKQVPVLRQNNICLKDFFEAQKYKERKINITTEGVYEVLEYLQSRGYYLCILTNGFYEEQMASLKCQKLIRYFEKVYTWDNFYGKPDRRAFIRALDQTESQDNIMIGNNILHDILPAKKLGIYTFGIHLKENVKADDLPDIELKKLMDLKKYL